MSLKILEQQNGLKIVCLEDGVDATSVKYKITEGTCTTQSHILDIYLQNKVLSINSPFNGKILDINSNLTMNPSLLRTDPWKCGHLFIVQPSLKNKRKR